ncbi:MAG TPA: HlyD family efflux transporter periplasmic adaptor subunit [Pirellulaceae bacterium]|nr:HlyD family efflux transporter periplasmic adaptor subunit [Pirellulaceae bacterium]HMO93349.1 HlyD family efflux transporter periplasmic adaptor subunit [Pirellulaceae bacterium]HMP70120.1 HlyD family efflux transporter periplasmic adaptor subunit [Pirellulaceae bacterium]
MSRTKSVEFEHRSQSLRHLLEKMQANAAVIWDCSSVPFTLLTQHCLSGEQVRLELTANEHTQLLEDALSGLHTVSFVEIKKNLQIQTVAIGKLHVQNHLALIEVVFDEVIDDTRRQKVGAILAAYCGRQHDLPDSHESLSAPLGMNTNTAKAGSAIGAIDQFAKAVHRSLDLRETSFEIVNEMQALIDCDRVALLQKIDDAWKAIAFSGQSQLAARSNSIRALESMVQRQLAGKTALWYSELVNSAAMNYENTEVELDVESVTREYRALSNAKEIIVLPLFHSIGNTRQTTTAAGGTSGPNPEATSPDSADRTLVGALVLEQFGQASILEKRAAIELLQKHAELSFGNAIAHQNLPFFSIVNFLGKLSAIRLRTRRKKLMAAIVTFAAIVLVLTFGKAEFKLPVDGILLPEDRRNVFAEVEGDIRKVLVKHGDLVSSGQVLLEMASDQLEIYLEDLNGKIVTTEKQIEAIVEATVRAEQRGSDPAQTAMLNVERSKLRETLTSLREELRIAETRREKLKVRSPIDGHVLSWQLESLLEDRPVGYGHRLMEIGRLDGDWVVELLVPDKHAGKLVEAKRQASVPLQVSFLIASAPSEMFTGEVSEIAKTTIDDPLLGRVVRVKVKILDPNVNFRQVRTEVKAKIHLGKSSLGYIWLHDLFDFVRSQIFFRMF